VERTLSVPLPQWRIQDLPREDGGTMASARSAILDGSPLSRRICEEGEGRTMANARSASLDGGPGISAVNNFSREIIFEEFQRVWSQSTNVTDRRTDRRTTYHGNTALRYASRGKKGWMCCRTEASPTKAQGYTVGLRSVPCVRILFLERYVRTLTYSIIA